MAWLAKRRRWLEWIVIALVLGWIGTIAWRHGVERSVAPAVTRVPPTEGAP